MLFSELKQRLCAVRPTAKPAARSQLVGRLLTAEEMIAVSGGSYCMGTGHAQSPDSTYTQSGGTYEQSGGGSYTMSCPPPDPGPGGGKGGLIRGEEDLQQ